MTTSMAIIWFLILFFLVLSSLSSDSNINAQTTSDDQVGRAPHGLAYEYPLPFSPSAYRFFHSNSPKPDVASVPCILSNCAPLPQASAFLTDQSLEADHENKVTGSDGQVNNQIRVGAGGVAGIVFGFVFAVLLAMGAFYVVVKRRANVRRANSVQPDV